MTSNHNDKHVSNPVNNTVAAKKPIKESIDKKAIKDSIDKKSEILSNVSTGLRGVFKVPIDKKFPDAYTPSKFSIGPVHATSSNIEAMEDFKWAYAAYFLTKSTKPGNIEILDKCIDVVYDLEPECRLYFYACDLRHVNKTQLCEVLLIDGCFILEVFRRFCKKNGHDYFPSVSNTLYQDIDINNDPILVNSWIIKILQHDLALLQNQVPFKLLQELLSCAYDEMEEGYSIKDVVAKCVVEVYRPVLHLNNVIGFSGNHLLGVLHDGCRLTSSGYAQVTGFKSSAFKLLHSGIVIKKCDSQETRFLDFKFDEGVLTIPPLTLGGNMSTIIKNLIAFEQLTFYTTRHYVSAYALLMGSLVRDRSDTQLLEEKGIIVQESGVNKEDVLEFFNTVSSKIIPRDFFFAQLCCQVEKYIRNRTWYDRFKASLFVFVFYDLRIKARENWRILKRDYFPDPWRTIALLVAFAILVFTALQTIYTILSYYKKP